MNCPYVHYGKLSSIRPYLHCIQAMYIRPEACVDCTQHPTSRDLMNSILTSLLTNLD